MHVAVTGASGFLGSHLVPLLRKDGHRVTRLVRKAATAPDEVRWDPTAEHLDPRDLADVNAVVHLAGPGIGDRRWTSRRKALVRDSRVKGTRTVATALARITDADGRERTLLSASAIGWYGDTGDDVRDERAPAGEGFLAEICSVWEGATQPAAEAGVRVATMRSGLVLAPRGGMMGRLLPLYRLGLGGQLSSGDMWWSWISLVDEVNAMRFLLTRSVSGPVNLVAPNPVTNAEFSRELAAALHRPAVFRVPRPALRAALGEFANEGIFFGQRLSPRVLSESGFVWTHPDLTSALRWCVA